LRPAEIESLREDSRLALKIARVLHALENVKSHGGTAAEIETLGEKLKSLEAQMEANNTRSGAED